MRAVILAAGIGSRLGDITNGLPKCFLEVNGKSIIQHQIDTLKSFGIKDILIVTGNKKHYFEKFKSQDIVLGYNPFFRITNVLGSFWFASEFLTEPFVYLHGDTYFESEVLNKLLSMPGNNLAVEFKKCGDEEMKVSVVNSGVVEISKSIKNADGEFIGVAKLEDFFEIKEMVSSLIEENAMSFFELVIMHLIRKNIRFNAVDVTGLVWEEIDFKEDYYGLLEKLSSSN